MEEASAMEVDASIGKQLTGKPEKIPVKKQKPTTTTTTTNNKREKPVDVNEQTFPPDASAKDRNDDDEAEAAPPGITVSLFDYSVENHLRAIDMISELCCEPEFELEQSEIQRLSSSITFIREWRSFCYKPRIIKFACKTETPLRNDVFGLTNLPQFSAAAVPKKEEPNGSNIEPGLSKDFAMYVGGSVWALDWCPRAYQTSECDIRSEFLAVAAHPPDSSYHRIGAPLTGRGVIQIWCLLNVGVQEEVPAQLKNKPKQNSRSTEAMNHAKTQPKKPRGRPRKKPIDESVDNLDGNSQYVQALAVQLPEDPSNLLPTDGMSKDTLEQVAKEDTGKNCSSSNGCPAEPQPNPRSSEKINDKLGEPQKPRRRPRKKPRNGSVDNLDGNDQCVQALAVQPQDSSNLLHTDRISQDIPEQVANESAGGNQDGTSGGISAEQQQNHKGTETINVKSSKPQKLRGRPRKKPINESVNYLDGNNQYTQALYAQFPEDSCKSFSRDGICQDNREQIGGNQNGIKEGVSGEQQQNQCGTETINVKSSPHKTRGRPRMKTANESVFNLDSKNQLMEVLSVQFPDDSSKLLRTGGISLDFHEQAADENTGRNQNGTKKGASAEEQQNPSTTDTINANSSQPQKPRGKHRKKPINGTADNSDGNNQCVKALAVQFPEDSSRSYSADGVSLDTPEQVGKKDTCRKCNVAIEGGSEELHQNPEGTAAINVKSSAIQKLKGRPRKKSMDESAHIPAVKLPEDTSKMLPTREVSPKTHEEITKIDLSRKRKVPDQGDLEDLVFTASKPQRMQDKAKKESHFHGTALPLLAKNKEMSLVNPETSSNCGHDPVGSSENAANIGSLVINPAKYSIPTDVALPRVVLCLAHNGKVAWDVKWRPSDSYAKSKQCMGYLAVLLGNGALEVWDIPLPRATKIIYASCQKEGIDPRFVKLEPVFRCSILKYGDRQSIPLTVEWSASSPHDLILAGCHDGVVALWKFSSSYPCKDTRPLLCFSADTVPIRALAWAPTESDPESANVIVTAGHKGLKFWDIRDPFRPLWDLNPVQRVIYSLDWLPDPRCLILSFDDGIRILSLSKAAYDVPVTGKPFVGTPHQGLHSYHCSSFTIWSVHVSRLTGMVAYCSADGTVPRFQLTHRAVEKDPLRNRASHFLCGSLTEEESALTVISPLLDIPIPMKKSLNEWANAPRTIRGFLSASNQEKRAKELKAKNKNAEPPLEALCYGDEPGSEFGPDDALMTPKSKQKPKAKSSSKKKLPEADQALIPIEEESMKGETGDENEIEEMPPKIVAMHRVRWNMNKGSERWLCYGGAGGIVRCQEINSS